MRKLGSDSPTARGRTGRTYWVRDALSPIPEADRVAPAPAVKKPKGKRFVEPYRLSHEQRAGIVAALQAHGVGDDDSRSLFAAAMEYDLAGCQVLTAPSPEPARAPRPRLSAADKAIAEVATAARALAEQVGRLDAGTIVRLQAALKEADRFKRTYGDDYLRSLRCELERVAAVAPAASPKPAPNPKPDMPETARRFILGAADAFGDCFEVKATAQRGSPFLAVLNAIVAATGVLVPVDQPTVAELLAAR